jgi:hypothetical protein
MRKIESWLWIPLLSTLGACSGGKDADDTGGASNCLPFAPSNLPEDIGCDSTEELVLSSENCSGYVDLCFHTDKGIVGYAVSGDRCLGTCADMEFGFQVVEQSDLTEIAVFTARSIRIDPTIRVYVSGQRPLALVAQETIEVLGSLNAIPEDLYMNQSHGGGFSGPSDTTNLDGDGPGGGGAGNEEGIGGGGGGYCGTGGAGGNADDSTGLGGVSNGNSSVVPLRGGSSGATQGHGQGGGGGGAIQLVAGQSIQLTDLGSMHVGGGGGERWAGGGGAGGAILLEAETVTMAGILAANGGGGAGGGTDAWHGEAAQGNSIAAAGGVGDEDDGCCAGGSGSAGSTTTGSDGESGGGESGGGGGAGWIRINTTSGAADITGTLSPEPGDCVSEGSVTPQ